LRVGAARLGSDVGRQITVALDVQDEDDDDDDDNVPSIRRRKSRRLSLAGRSESVMRLDNFRAAF